MRFDDVSSLRHSLGIVQGPSWLAQLNRELSTAIGAYFSAPAWHVVSTITKPTGRRTRPHLQSADYVGTQMYNSFRQTMEQYFSPSANLPNVETVVTEHTPALRSFKVIAEFPLMRAHPARS